MTLSCQRMRAICAAAAISVLFGCSDGGGRVRPKVVPSASPSPSVVVVSPAPAPAPFLELSVIGTSDLHGRITTLPRLGGFLTLLRATRPVLLVDGGDMFQGTLESNGVEGEVVVAAYRGLGYDAVAIGNHEFDYGPVGPAAVARAGEDAQGALRARAAQAKGAFPFLSANLRDASTGALPTWDNVAATRLVERGGLQVGIIGISTESTPRTTMAANFAGLAVAPLAEVVTTEAAALRARGAEVVVVTAHAGGKCGKLDASAPDDLGSCDQREEIFEVARALPAGAVDVIVGGHTHQGVAHKVNGIAIVQSFANGKAFGRVDLTWDRAGKRVSAVKIFPPQSVEDESYQGVQVVPEAAIEKIITPAVEAAAARRGEPLGVTLEGPLKRDYDAESALGNLVATLMLEAGADADIAITNGGGLRADLPAGPLTYGAVYDAQPFDNRFARLTMTGRQLRALVKRNLSSTGGILSLAGVTVEAVCVRAKLEVTLLREAKGKKKKATPIADGDSLQILTSDFLATGGDDFGKADKVVIDEAGEPLREAVVARLRARGGILRAAEWLTPARIKLPGKRPVRCKN